MEINGVRLGYRCIEFNLQVARTSSKLKLVLYTPVAQAAPHWSQSADGRATARLLRYTAPHSRLIFKFSLKLRSN
jgi:hypothetical protein